MNPHLLAATRGTPRTRRNQRGNSAKRFLDHHVCLTQHPVRVNACKCKSPPAIICVEGKRAFGPCVVQVFKLSELVCRIDEKMHQHIEAQGLQFLQFAFRWFNCLVLREVPFRLVARLWDTYTAEGADKFSEFLVYVCAALLLTWADELKAMEFQDMVRVDVQ